MLVRSSGEGQHAKPEFFPLLPTHLDAPRDGQVTHGDAVLFVQQWLCGRGFACELTGRHEGDSVEAVRHFQLEALEYAPSEEALEEHHNGRVADGQLGPDTRADIKNVYDFDFDAVPCRDLGYNGTVWHINGDAQPRHALAA